MDGLRVWSWASFDAAKVDELVVVFFLYWVLSRRDETWLTFCYVLFAFAFFFLFRLALLFGVFFWNDLICFVFSFFLACVFWHVCVVVCGGRACFSVV